MHRIEPRYGHGKVDESTYANKRRNSRSRRDIPALTNPQPSGSNPSALLKKRELVVPVADLPAGAHEGHWLNVQLHGERLVHAEIDHEATDRARERVRAKMDQLRQRGRRLSGT